MTEKRLGCKTKDDNQTMRLISKTSDIENI